MPTKNIAKPAKKQEADISALVVVLCDMLEDWSKNPESFPIGDIDKAVAALKKLQEIQSAEQDNAAEAGTVVVTHCVPRPKESEAAENI